SINLRETRYYSLFHNRSMSSRGIKMPVFLRQNQKKFSFPWPQPNSQPIKERVLTALPCIDQSNCGPAMIDATTKNVSHSRHCRQLIKARHAPTPITVMKLCA